MWGTHPPGAIVTQMMASGPDSDSVQVTTLQNGGGHTDPSCPQPIPRDTSCTGDTISRVLGSFCIFFNVFEHFLKFGVEFF